jgi:hypothetical protein
MRTEGERRDISDSESRKRKEKGEKRTREVRGKRERSYGKRGD